jgi:hemerythrin
MGRNPPFTPQCSPQHDREPEAAYEGSDAPGSAEPSPPERVPRIQVSKHERLAMTILWRPAMAIGDDMVDTDHQHLIDLINTVELTLQASVGEVSMAGALDALAAYTKEHFDREETLMRVIGYDRLAEHREAHHNLRGRLFEIRRHIEEAKAKVAPPHEVQKLIELLRAWLLDHVMKEDMLLKPALARRG